MGINAVEREASVRRHHEEIAAAPALIATVTTLIPIGVALWIRIKEWCGPGDNAAPRK